jgi:hypothetical protein
MTQTDRPTRAADILAALVEQLKSDLGDCAPGTTITIVSMTAAGPSLTASARAEDRPRTAEEAADFFQVQCETVQRWCREGRFPGAVRVVGAGWRIPADNFRLSALPEDSSLRE